MKGYQNIKIIGFFWFWNVCRRQKNVLWGKILQYSVVNPKLSMTSHPYLCFEVNLANAFMKVYLFCIFNESSQKRQQMDPMF